MFMKIVEVIYFYYSLLNIFFFNFAADVKILE